MQQTLPADTEEGLCPICHKTMCNKSPQHYYCEYCRQHYVEQFICPTCQQQAQRVKGCGAINYICQNDGLISSRKIIFNYLPE